MEIIKDYTHGGNVHKASTELNIPKKRIIDFSANINPLGMSPLGLKAIKKGMPNILDYPDPDYSELKDSLSCYYSVNNDNILLGNGAIELIYSYSRLKVTGRALIPGPGFVEYEKALLSSGWEVTLYNKKSKINLENIDVVFICNPNNPTGISYSEVFLLDLIKQGKKYGTDIFLDEAFIEYSSYKSMKNYLNEYDNLYILKSLTKFFAIPGLRLGCLLTSNISFKSNFNKNIIPWSINSIATDYINCSVTDTKYISASKKFIKKERFWLYSKLLEVPGIQVFRSQGNYLMFKLNTNIDLCSEFKKYGVLIRSCENYNNLDGSFYRVAVKSRKHNKRLIILLRKILKI